MGNSLASPRYGSNSMNPTIPRATSHEHVGVTMSNQMAIRDGTAAAATPSGAATHTNTGGVGVGVGRLEKKTSNPSLFSQTSLAFQSQSQSEAANRNSSSVDFSQTMPPPTLSLSSYRAQTNGEGNYAGGDGGVGGDLGDDITDAGRLQRLLARNTKEYMQRNLRPYLSLFHSRHAHNHPEEHKRAGGDKAGEKDNKDSKLQAAQSPYQKPRTPKTPRHQKALDNYLAATNNVLRSDEGQHIIVAQPPGQYVTSPVKSNSGFVLQDRQDQDREVRDMQQMSSRQGGFGHSERLPPVR